MCWNGRESNLPRYQYMFSISSMKKNMGKKETVWTVWRMKERKEGKKKERKEKKHPHGLFIFIWCYYDIMITIWGFLINYRNMGLGFRTLPKVGHILEVDWNTTTSW